MKKSHIKETKVDLLKPVLGGIIPEGLIPESTDCFGQEFEGRSSECSVCSDSDLCMIIWTEKVRIKKSAFEAEHTPLLDQTDLPGLDMVKIEKLARKYESENQPMTFGELQDIVKIQVNTKDDETVIQLLKRKLPLSLMYLKEGNVYVR